MKTDRQFGCEWLEADGLGGFASGTVNGERTRRYHALLQCATTPPTGRMVLVNGMDAWVRTSRGTFALSTHAYLPGVRHPNGADHIESFQSDPWPTWQFRLPDGSAIIHEVFVPAGTSAVAISWRMAEPRPGTILIVRPLISGRGHHALHFENGNFDSRAEVEERVVAWKPYHDVPLIAAESNGSYQHEPVWYRQFLYEEERSRGQDFSEDLASPGSFQFDLYRGEALWLLSAGRSRQGGNGGGERESEEAALEAFVEQLRSKERRRRARFPSRLHRSADAYVVRRGAGKTIIAGYPWFADWGRDTFIAMRGLTIATGRLDDARAILCQWAPTVSMGMLPNRFIGHEESAEFNSVDASLWFVIAVEDYLRAHELRSGRVPVEDLQILGDAVRAILDGYTAGTRYNIHADTDGLLAAGVPGVQLTWMDAKIGDWVVTPRIGKPVEVQALWLNALAIGARFSDRWQALLAKGRAKFLARFWNDEAGCLYDVVDEDHVSGRCDASIRPNQIFAVGGLPLPLLEGVRAKQVVQVVERELLTPLGLRSLARDASGYAARYEGGPKERDAAYHQGTVWPWLIGAFVEAWLRTHESNPLIREEARIRFIEPLLAHLDVAGQGHISEIADAEPPHTPRGCPFQAWSLGEVLRVVSGALAAPRIKTAAPVDVDEVRSMRGVSARTAPAASASRQITRVTPSPKKTLSE